MSLITGTSLSMSPAPRINSSEGLVSLIYSITSAFSILFLLGFTIFSISHSEVIPGMGNSLAG